MTPGFEGKRFGCIHTPPERLVKVPFALDFLDEVSAGKIPNLSDTLNYSARWRTQMVKNGFLGNNKWGNCVEVAVFANCPGTQAVNATGALLTFTEQEMLDYYKTIVPGFDPNDPNTDTGTDPVDALIYAKKQGLILAYGQVNLQDPVHMSLAAEYFGGVLLATDVPGSWEQSQVWGVTDQNTDPIVGSHMVVLPDYSLAGDFAVETWAEIVLMKQAALRKYGQAAYVAITPDWFAANQQTLQGFSLASLEAQLMNVQ